MKRKYYLYISLAFVLAVASILFLLYNKGHKSIVNMAPDFVLTASELLEAYSQDERRADDLYLGQILQVTGMVSEVKEDGNGSGVVILDTGSLMESIQCEMDLAFRHGQAAEGQTLSIKGFCAGKIMDIVLNRCVIVE